MNNKGLKQKIITIMFILTLTISAFLVVLPAVNAQEVGSMKTYAFIGAVPNPVGVNQEVLLHIGITQQLAATQNGYEGLTVTVTRPDGQTETLGPFRTDSTGGTGSLYTPTLVGTYTLQTHFPEQEYPQTAARPPILEGTVMLASNSNILQLVVQADPIAYYPGFELPTEYWTRPIDAQLREWSTISANWVDIPPNRYAPYNDDAPETAHILWTTPLLMGGLAGGSLGDHAFECGDAYEGYFPSSIIIGGILFYNDFNSRGGTNVEHHVVAVDLHTGEELWRRNWDNRMLDFGQVFYWDSYNYHAAFDYLWETTGSTWRAFDAFTGRWEYTMENVPSGTRVNGPKGEIFIYTVNTNAGWMTLWNSSRVVSDAGSWRPQGNTYDAIDGIEWNVTIPAGLPGSVNVVLEDRIIGSDIPGWSSFAIQPITMWGLSLNKGHEGTLLFKQVWNPPAGNITMLYGTASLEDGVFVVTAKELMGVYGFSLNTGEQLWGPTGPQPYMDIYTLGELRAITRGVIIAYGKLFSVGVAGIVHCYNVNTGTLLWTYEATDFYSEILWANDWWLNIAFIADGKIYLVHDEHSPIDPKPRGAPTICLDVENGEEVWKIDGAFRGTQWGGTGIIGDSIIATMDTYDQRIYAIGKGPSSITVNAPEDAQPLTTPVLIKGTVTDVSPGTDDVALKMRFPSGVPAIADEYMSEWMLYVYKQFKRPDDAMGVPVRIQVVDPNGAYAWIGTATSDSYGNYQYSFIPQLKGTYTIIATFAGSAAYYGSQQTTYMTVSDAPTKVTIPPYPSYQGPSAQDVANSVVASLPADATPQQVAQAVVNAMPEYPEPDPVVIPEYTTIDIVLVILVAIAIILCVILLLRKK